MEDYDFEKMTVETLKTVLCQGLSDKLESLFGSVFFVDESTCKEQGDFEDFVNGKTKERVTYQWRISKVTGGLFLKLVNAPEEYKDKLKKNWLLEWIWSGETKY